MAKKPVWIEREVFRPYSYIVDHVAKKEHKCRKCDSIISPGILYYEKKIMTPSYYFFSERYCENCFNNFIQKKIDLD